MGTEIFLEEAKIIVSKTDLQGKITYGNSYFIEISGYDESELLGAPHNILRHPDMPRVVFKLLWEYIKSGREIFAYVKNKSKHDDFYWVLANVTPSFDLNGNIIGYLSVRRKPKREAIEIVSELYAKLLEVEKSSGMEKSEELLKQILKEKGKSYEEFIFTI